MSAKKSDDSDFMLYVAGGALILFVLACLGGALVILSDLLGIYATIVR